MKTSLLCQVRSLVGSSQVKEVIGVNQVYYNGKLLVDEDTKISLKMEPLSVLLCVGTKATTGKRWFRTRLESIRSQGSNWRISTTAADALRFIAKRRVLIMGFGCTGPAASESADRLFGWSLKVSYKVSDYPETEKVIFTAE